MRRLFLKAALLMLICIATRANAQDIVLGNTLPLSGPLGAAGRSALTGIQAYLARVKRDGGIGGRQVVLHSLDDAYDPVRHEENVRRLLELDRVDALVLSAGTTNVSNAYPVVEHHRKPLIGPLTGGSELRGPTRPLIYHLRASYADEVRRLTHQAATVLQSRIFAVWQDDGLGRDAFAALQHAVKDQKLQLVGQQNVVLANMDGTALAQTIRAAKPDALFMLCVTSCAAKLLSSLALDDSYKLTPYVLSIVSGETLAATVGKLARGTVISQVLPNPRVAKTSLVRRYQEDMRQFSDQADFSYFSLEGYVAAMVAVEAARVAYGGPAQRSMDEAMRILTQREIEGISVSSGNLPGVRPHFVELSMIGLDGRLIH